MQKKLMGYLLIFFLFLSVSPVLTNAASDQDEALKKHMEEGGYLPLNEAISKFEAINNKKVKLPQIPFEANHKMGIVGKEGYLKMNWINTKKDKTETFILFVKKKDNKDFYFSNEKEDKLVKLHDGNSAYYKEDNSYKLVFEDNGLEYCYMVSKNEGLSNKEFVQIAKTFK
jgi:hypothetical protein